MFQDGLKIVHKWSKVVEMVKNGQNWYKNISILVQKWFKMVQKWFKNGPKMVQKWSENYSTMDIKMILKWTKMVQNGLKIIQKLSAGGQNWLKWSETGPKMVKKMF